MLYRPSNAAIGRVALLAGALLAILLLAVYLQNSVFAQDSGPIPYPENGTEPVATFTGTDPEERPVYWSLAPDGTNFNNVDGVADGDEDDVDHFVISSDGVLSFKFSPDYEMPREAVIATGNTNTYKVVVVASDDAMGVTGRMMGYKKVTVVVTDVDEPGMVTLSAQQPQDSVALTVTLTDDDATPAQITAAKWKWEQTANMDEPWTVVVGATADAYTPVAGLAGRYLRATATYTDEFGSDKSEMAMSAQMVRKAPTGNVAPVADDATRSIDENSAPGTKVGKPVTATDTPGDVLTYTLGGIDGGDYRIDAATGQITVGTRTMLDRDEPNEEDTVTVTATDPSGETDDATVTITINDVNEAPMMTGGATRVSHDENIVIATAVDSYTATDPEIGGGACVAASCTWSVSGTDAGDFNISNETGTYGELTFKKVPNYEMPEDSNRDNVYMVEVVVTDIGVDGKNKMSAERDVVITVMNLGENGTVTLSSVQPKVGVPLTASVTDLDGDVKDITWKWYDDTIDENDLAVNAIADATSDTYTPVVGDVGETLSARAMYTDGKGSDNASAVATNEVIVDLANRAPMFKKGDVEISTDTREVAEGTSGDVGAPVSATDPNDTDKLTYKLSGTDAASFTISNVDDATAGQISVGSGVKLDYETKKSYMVTVTATDPDGLSASINVTIKVTNMDEAPEIVVGGLVRFSAKDPEKRMVYWSQLDDASGTQDTDGDGTDDVGTTDVEDQGDFTISTDGVLSFVIPPDHEDADDQGTDNTYKVVVVAISGMSRVDYAEDRTDAVGTYTASGPDADMATWSLDGDDAGDFRISSGGMLTLQELARLREPDRHGHGQHVHGNHHGR